MPAAFGSDADTVRNAKSGQKYVHFPPRTQHVQVFHACSPGSGRVVATYRERKGRDGKCFYGHLLHDMLEILLCTVQWRYIAEMLSCWFKKEWQKRDSNQPLISLMVTLGDWDMREPSLVTVSAPSYLHELRQWRNCSVKFLIYEMGLEVFPDLVVVVVGKNTLKFTICSAPILKRSMWASFFWKLPWDLMETDNFQWKI